MEIQQNQQQTIQQQIEQQFSQFIQPKLQQPVVQPQQQQPIQPQQPIQQPQQPIQQPFQNELINNNTEETLFQSNVIETNEQINITPTTTTTTTTNNITSPVPKKRGRPPKNPLAASGSTQTTPVKSTEEFKEGHPTKQQKLNSSTNIVDNIFEYNNIEEDEHSFQCPICKNKFPKDQIDQHYQYELKKLDSGGTNSESGSLSSSASSTPTLNQVNLALFSSAKIRTPRKASLDAIIKSRFTESGREFDKINSTLSSIKQNREKRCNVNGIPLSSISNNIIDQPSDSAAVTCFLCNLELKGTVYEMNCHVDECLKNQNNKQIPTFKSTLEPHHLNNSSSTLVSQSQQQQQQLLPLQPLQRKRGRPSKQQQLQREQEQQQIQQKQQKNDEDSSSEDEVYNEEDFKDLPPGAEVYEFAGKVRIRTCSLLPNGYTGVLFDKKQKTSEKDDIEDDLDIEDDDTLKFGNVQYSEEDLNEDKIVDNNSEVTPTTTTTTTSTSTTNSNNEEIGTNNQADSADNNNNGFNNVNSFQNINSSNALNSINNNSFLIESLKQKLKDQDQLLKDTPSCLICMGTYRIPLVSINCWHVHCEDCWLGTLKVKKWCPQCNIITCPQDLRKIYL